MMPAAATAKSLQSCPTLCDPIDSPPGSSIPGILQARTLEWVAISFSNAGKWKWSCSVVSDSSRPHGLQPTRLLLPWDFPGKSTGVGCHCLNDAYLTYFDISDPLTLLFILMFIMYVSHTSLAWQFYEGNNLCLFCVLVYPQNLK